MQIEKSNIGLAYQKLKFILIFFGLSMLFYFPYIGKGVRGVLCGILVIISTFIGYKRWGIIASIYSTIILLFFNIYKGLIIWNNFWSPNGYMFLLNISIFFIISIGFGSLLEYHKKLQRKLIRKDLEKELILDNASSYIFSIEVDNKGKHRYKYFNSSMEELMGLDTSEIKGKTSKEVFGEEVGSKCEDNIKKCIQLRESISIERELKLSEKKKIFLVTIAPVIIDSKIIEIIGSAEDITEYKQMQDKLLEINQKLEEKSKQKQKLVNELDAQLEKGRKLHKQFFPNQLPETNSFSIGSYYQPAKKVGGDFYNFIELNNQLIGYIVDITGHGIGGALINIFIRETINSFLLRHGNSKERISPIQILNYLIEKFQNEAFPDDYFICILPFVIDEDKEEITYSNAGFQIPPLLIDNSEITESNVKGLPITNTIALDQYQFEKRKFNFNDDDAILLTTDGLVEEMNQGERYGNERIKEILFNNQYCPPQIIIDKIINNFRQFCQNFKPQDDITFVMIKKKDLIDKLSKEIPSNYQKLEKVEEEIINFIKKYYSKTDELLMGLREILVNAIEHGNKEIEGKEVEIEVEMTKKKITIKIKDQGTGFDWRENSNKGMECLNCEESGRGIAIAKMNYDHIYYNKKGNEAYMVKCRT